MPTDVMTPSLQQPGVMVMYSALIYCFPHLFPVEKPLNHKPFLSILRIYTVVTYIVGSRLDGILKK